MVKRAQIPALEEPVRPAIRRRGPGRFWSRLMVFAATVVLVNGLFGERGLMDSLRARRALAVSARELGRLKRDNAALRDTASRLRSNPATIEAVARGELGLARRGEILITVKDRKPPR